MITLFPDQTSLVNDVRQAMNRHKNILIRAETGFGKTYLSAAMIQMAVSKGTTCGFVVPRKELLKQTAKTFNKEGIKFGYVAAGYTPNKHALVQLCTSGSLVNRLDVVTPPKLMFVDEVQFGSTQLDRIIQWAKNTGCWIIGLSATPWRLDGVGLGCWFDYMVEGPSLSELITSKRLSGYRMFAPQTPDLSGVRVSASGEYAKCQVSERMNSVLVGNAIEHYKKHANGTIAAAFCVSVAKAEELANMANDAGVRAGCIHGGMGGDEIDKLIMKLANREIQILSSCELLTFGFDLSSRAGKDVTLETMIDCQPTKSFARQRQKNGRVLRAKDFPALIFDHAGNSSEHGLPDDDYEWTLENRVKGKGGNSEPTLPTRQCTNCYYVHRPTPICPNCGFVYPVQSREIEEIDGELEEVQRKIEIKTRKMEQGQARTLPELVAVGKSRGMANPTGWARRVVMGRQRG